MNQSNNIAQYDDPYRHPQETWNNSPVPSPHPYAPASPQPPYTSVNNSSITVVDSDIPNDGNKVPRDIARTPSPTPSEAKQLRTGGLLSGEDARNWRFWIRREWFWYYVVLSVILTLTTLMLVFHNQIINWLTPFTRWLHDLKFGWLVPIGIIFVLSFPPLFGQEIVAVLCGLVWGLWIGFGIVAAGTFLGEVGNFYAFKYCCRSRGEKLEHKNIMYACLAKVIRDGGFKIALIARLITTALFSTCGMGIVTFCIAAILSMPMNLINVYLGVILEQSATGETDKKSKIISTVVLVLTIMITVGAMHYILKQINKVKPGIIYARRKARQAKLARSDMPYDRSDAFDASVSDVNIPLTSRAATQAERSDPYPFSQSYQYGSHAGTEPTNVVYIPTPKVPKNEYSRL
ncbi:hypothetical protein IW261DRAFT_1569658 [Armillaria novae-zelandiae]|uniref:Golgi apparatus membrane protein TVP38 n=1 Tax=Armillaria novae-zelandiae TaxID=153914 RepID=A0AA39NXA4_9AGAR|nr:hypothetical protein IW261DRAFT_1569658 [Armillaria novae-zelandiae]